MSKKKIKLCEMVEAIAWLLYKKNMCMINNDGPTCHDELLLSYEQYKYLKNCGVVE